MRLRTTSIFALALVTIPRVHGRSLPSSLLDLVRARMNQSSTASWEIGTRLETLTEIDFPEVAVFSQSYDSPTPPSPATLNPVLSIARQVINSRTNQQLVADGSAGDPASIGVAVLLGNFTNAPGANWASAATDQLNALLNNTPRAENGALSHRTESVQLWSDFVYMVPPFLAYYGVMTSNTSIINEAYNQISAYRDILRDPDTNLWRHVIMANAASNSPLPNAASTSNPGNFNDTGFWSTGNAWVLGGMLRVLGTLKYSPFSKQFANQQDDIQDWIEEIHGAMAANLPSSGIFPNYVDDNSAFPDASSTAMFAATVYRYVTLAKPNKYSSVVQAAETARQALYANNGTTHFDSDGWLQPVVDPNEFSNAGKQSPEGQSFVLQLDNNWQTWKKSSSKSGALAVASLNEVLLGVAVSSLVGLMVLF